MSVSALPGENRPSKIHVEINEKTTINSVYPDLWPLRASRLQSFDCRVTVCLPNDVQECI